MIKRKIYETMRGFLIDLVCSGLSPDDDSLELYQIKRLNLAIISLVLCVPFFASIYYFLGIPQIAIGTSLTGVLAVLCFLWFRRTKNILLAANYLLLIYALLVFLATIYLGGIDASSLWWNTHLPVLAVLLLNIRWAVYWTILVISETTFFIFLTHSEILPANPLSGVVLLYHDGITIIVAIALLLVFGNLFILGRAKIIDVLERANVKLDRHAKELGRLYRASETFVSGGTIDLKSLAQAIVHVVFREFGQSNCSLLLVTPDSPELTRLAVADSFASETSLGLLTLNGPGLVPLAIRSGQIVNIPDVRANPDYVPHWEAASSEMVIPLKIGDQVIGAIDVQSEEPGAFSPEDERLMAAFAERASLALERQRSVDALNKFSSVIQQIADVVVITDSQGVIEYVNPAFESQTGYMLSEVQGQTLRVLKSGLHDEAFYENMWETILRGETYRGELINRKKNGEFGHVSHTITPLKNPQREITHFVAIWKDITDRVQAETQIREHNKLMGRLAKISENLNRSSTRDDVLVAIGKGALALSEADRAALYYRVSDSEIACLWNHNFSRMFIEQVTAFVGRRLAMRRHEDFAPILLSDIGSMPLDDSIQGLAAREGIRAYCAWPLNYEGRAIASVTCGFDAHHTWSEAEKEIMAAFARQAAIALQNALLFEEVQRRLKNLQALRTIDLAISGSLSLNTILGVVLEQVTSQLGADAAAILLFDRDSQILVFRAQRGFRTDALRYTQLRLGEGHAGRAALENRIVQIKDLTTGQTNLLRSPLLRNEHFISYVGAPLTAKGQIQGVLEIFHRSSLDPDDDWMNLVEALSTQAAIAIDNANLFKNLKRSNVELTLAYDTTLEGWAKALELRDEGTEGHTRRVTAMTERLAREMGFSEEQLAQLRRGALLHDIGKMGIPDSVLLKPGKLTEEEWEIMRQHPVHACHFLSQIEHLRPALDIPYCHHEKWDGTGYPRGLKGEQIPLAARIFAVVDVWDALNSDRPYRKAWKADEVIAYIQEQSGKHFDPHVVDVFLVVLESE